MINDPQTHGPSSAPPVRAVAPAWRAKLQHDRFPPGLLAKVVDWLERRDSCGIFSLRKQFGSEEALTNDIRDHLADVGFLAKKRHGLEWPVVGNVAPAELPPAPLAAGPVAESSASTVVESKGVDAERATAEVATAPGESSAEPCTNVPAASGPAGERREVLSLNALAVDTCLQPRVKLDDRAIRDFAAAMAGGEDFPPVVAFDDGSKLMLVDGFHRVAAARQAGLTEIRVRVISGSRRDALLYAVSANLKNAVRLKNKDKQRAVRLMLDDEELRQWNDSAIGRWCGVDPTTVARYRSRWEAEHGILCFPDDARKVRRRDKVLSQRARKAATAAAAGGGEPTRSRTKGAGALVDDRAAQALVQLGDAARRCGAAAKKLDPGDGTRGLDFAHAVEAIAADLTEIAAKLKRETKIAA